MKTRLLILTACLVAGATSPLPLSADVRFIVKDAAKMNELYQALGGPSWTRQKGWPIPTGETTTFSTPDHVQFATRTVVNGATITYEYYLKRLSLNSVGASGVMPASLEFDSLEAFYISHEPSVTGSFPRIISTKLREVEFYYVDLGGDVPDYSGSELRIFSVVGVGAAGRVPAMTVPNLTHYRVNDNATLKGPLGNLTAPKLEALYITYNDSLSGDLFAMDFPALKELQIRSNPMLQGTLTSLEFRNLTLCWITQNALGGTLPTVDLPACTTFHANLNQFVGSIGTLNLPAATYVNLSENLFDGTLAEQVLPECAEFNVAHNNLTGDFPAVSMPKCTTLYVNNNAFSGDVDRLNLPAVKRIIADVNKFNSELPASWRSAQLELVSLRSNELKGPLPPWIHATVQRLILSSNKLSGTVGALNCPRLIELNLNGNRCGGSLPLFSLPEATTMLLDSNRLTNLPHVKDGCPKLQRLDVNANKLMFDALERNLDIAQFHYVNQDSIELFVETLQDGRTRYHVEVAGAVRQYIWYKVVGPGHLSSYPDDNDTLIVPAGESALHFCQAFSPSVALTLTSRMHESAGGIANPWVVGNLSFFAEGGDGWQVEEGTSTIVFSGTVTVSDFLKFDGAIAIDTEAVSVEASGKFYLPDVPLPGGGTGTFVVSEGTYSLALLGESGAITNFLNSKLSKLPEIAGIKVELTNIKLVGGRQANGISISGKIKIDGLTNGCHDGEPGPTMIEIEDLAYTRTDGFSVGGMKVEDLGLSLFPRFCVKKIEANYDDRDNKLSFGASVAMPFAEVGGGVALIGDEVDSIAWRIEATEAAVPLGTSNLGMSGFFGSISGIKSTPLDVELGGVFVTMVPKDFVKFDASGTYTAPATIGLKIDGSAIPTPFEDDQYQLKLTGSAKFDFAESIAKLEGEAHVGTTDGEEYFIDGALKLDLFAKTLAVKGEISGGYTIQPFGDEDADEYPYDWMNTKLGLPKKVSTEARFCFNKGRVLYGVAHLGQSMGDIEYVFDFRKRWNDPDFLFWKRTPAAEGILVGGDGLASTRAYTVPQQSTRMVVRIVGATTLPASSLRMPDGTIISGSDAGKQIDYALAQGKPKAFWTILNPMPGTWTVDLPSAGGSDIVEAFIDAPSAPFTFTFTQQGRTLNLSWMPQGSEGDSMSFFVSGTGTTADGLLLGSAPTHAGSAVITLSDLLPVCYFEIEAQGTRDNDLVEYTSTSTVTVQQGALAAPSMMSARYYSGQHRMDISWAPVPASNTVTKSFVIIVRRSDGTEEVLGEAFRWVGWVSVGYDRRDGDHVYVRGVDGAGHAGCPAEIVDITTDVADDAPESYDGLTVRPHPVNQQAIITFFTISYGTTYITVYDLQGRVVMVNTVDNLDVGSHDLELNCANLPSGMYTIEVLCTDQIMRRPVIITR